ncbi:MAG: hypothetical protein A2498_06765 [Lentisphaerae bacterium RIFOXYC12_FULL_60_16]|nr:MAG: hypothetical protein A2498_06765 [Lentisphaerae bacterium RIFOXYC12_FULL_60_16]
MNDSPLPERLKQLRTQIMARKGSFPTNPTPYARDVALWRVFSNSLSTVQVRGALLKDLVALPPVEFPPLWSLAGEHLPGHYFGLRDPNRPPEPAHLAELGIDPGQVETIRQCVTGYINGYPYQAVGQIDPDTQRGRGSWGQNVYMSMGWMENHSVRDYARVLRLGFGGLREQVEERLGHIAITDPNRVQSENFLLAARDICDAGILLGKRYAETARRLADTVTDPTEKARLLHMAETCEQVPARGARTLFEATQALWLAHILTCGEDGINANSIGRLDQLLQPYYEADLQAGRTTRQAAVELMAELACKLYLEYDVQAIVLGGVDRTGKSAINEMTGIILEATRTVDFIRDLSVRVNRETPPAFYETCASMIVRGGGIPFLFNDDCFIPALVDHGIVLEDARDYAPIGCIELTIPGKANPHAVSGWFHATKCLELALFNGKDPRTGEQLGPETGLLTDFTNFDQLWDAYQRQVECFAERMVYNCNLGELRQRERGPLPCWSLLTDDCVARGRDITDGGAIYNYHSICFLGTANTADSLCAIQQLVFDQKKLSAATLLDALRANFEGHEPVRQLLLNGAPKYGNDQADVDQFAGRITNHFIDLMDGMRSPLGGRYVVHLFTFLLNIDFGKSLGATPDGRRAGEPVAYSLSAHQGRDLEGLTAMINSLARMPHKRAAGASAAIIDVDPSFVAGEAGVTLLAKVLQSAISMGVGQLQMNVTTAERLEQARQDPEHYGNIPVRVAGYSQMFKLISRELQDHIIARSKHKT